MTVIASLPDPGATLLTAAEVADQYGGQNVELVKGEIRELQTPFVKHGKLCMKFGFLLMQHTEKQDLGHVMRNDSFVVTRKNPDTVRGPDSCFYSSERLPKGEVPNGLLSVTPELVVEVRSPSDGWNEILIKDPVGCDYDIGFRLSQRRIPTDLS